jgi:hypothetical protein
MGVGLGTLKEEYRLEVFENRVLRRIFGPKREEAARGWRRVHNDLQILNASPNIIAVIQTRRMRCAGHVARMGQMRNAYKISVGKRVRKRHLEDIGVDGTIILQWILGNVWTRSMWLRIGSSGGTL